jgi:DMSO/TMAO reductase YedYZ molybdopterin-dependent catalytic subunit
MIINEGFKPKRQGNAGRLPPGQYETWDFPVLSFGPTPTIISDEWKLEIAGLVKKPTTLNWAEINALPQTEVETDIHCVTKWSKFSTHWSGVSLDFIMSEYGVSAEATHLIAHSYDGYTTNIPLDEIRGGKALVALSYEDSTIPPEHGGPARLFVPHLYFWKSAKWLKKIEFVEGDQPGFWEVRGYHNHGDPWKEERYSDQ